MFLPQIAALNRGTIKSQVCYPLDEQLFDDQVVKGTCLSFHFYYVVNINDTNRIGHKVLNNSDYGRDRGQFSCVWYYLCGISP